MVKAKDDDDDDKMVLEKVSQISRLNGRYKTIPKEGRFIIETPDAADAGNYTCSLGDESYNFNAYCKLH